MIVNKFVVGLHIIFHEAHGLLAGKIANEIAAEYRPIHWFKTLIAICEHDDRQLNFDKKDYLSDIGVPLDFTEERSSVGDVMKRMQRILKSAGNKYLWVKLLIFYHLKFIYSHLKEDSKQITNFFINKKQVRQNILKLFKISDKKAMTHYEFLCFCNRLSLILCKDEAPDHDRLLEINTSINGETYFIKKQKNNEMIISPWIFSTDKFELSVEERILRKSQFASSSQFETVLMDCKPQFK